MNKALHWLIAAVFAFSAIAAQAGTTQDDQVEHYVKIFSGDRPDLQTKAARELEWAGLSDARLFDIIEKNLKGRYLDGDKITADYVSWMAKALGFSGNEKYRATLQEVAKNAANKNTRKHATNALESLDQYKVWNPMISSTANWNSGKSVEMNKLANMLRSGDRELQRMAAKRISYARIGDKWLLDILNTETQKAIKAPVTGKIDADAVSWMVRMLAMAPNHMDYRATVEDAANNATDKKVRSNAGKYLKQYYGG